MPTIKDIAKEAGVSHGTVSNVLNKTGKVSTEKIRLVESAARRLGYVPNAQARRLRQGARVTVALLLPTLRKDTYLDLYTALLRELPPLGYEISFSITEDIESREEEILERLPRAGLAAIVAVSCLGDRAAQSYSGFSCPVIFVDRDVCTQPAADRAFAGFDLFQAGCDLGRHVLARGAKQIAFFSSPSRFSDDHQLYLGLMSVVEGRADVQRFSSDASLARSKAFQILASEEPIDTVVSTGLFRAEALSNAIACRRPEQAPYLVTLCSSELFPSLGYNGYSLDYDQLGATIVKLLQNRLLENKELPSNTTLPCKGFPFQFPWLVRTEPQTLSLLTLNSPSTTALQGLLPMFRDATGITLSITSLDYDDLYEAVQILNDRYYYDMVRIDVAWLDTLGARLYQPLEQAGLDAGMFPDPLVGSPGRTYTHVGDTAYTLPFDPSAMILLYRSDLFSDATLRRAYYEKYHESLEVPENFSQLTRAAEFFTREYNPDSPTLYGITCAKGPTIITACSFLPFYMANGGPVIRGGRLRLDTPELAAAIEQYLELHKYAGKSNNLWWSDSVQEFAEGVSATVLTFSNHVNYLMNSKHSNVVGRVNAAVMPGGKTVLGGGVLGVSRYSEKAEACRQFIRWYYSQDVSSALISLGGTSPLVGSYGEARNLAVFPWLSATRDSLECGVRGIDKTILPDFSNRHFETVLGMAVRQVFSGSMTPKQAAEFAQSIY